MCRRTHVFAAAGLMAGLVFGAASPARADVKVSALVGDHMMIQQGRPVWLSGTAAAGESIAASLAGSRVATRADAAGRWHLSLPAQTAGGPFGLTIEGSSTLTFADVWVGEVWLASGQSNMEIPLTRSTGADEAVAGGCAGLRLFTVSHKTAAAPASDVEGRWRACDAATAAGFSAVAYHFGRELHRTLGVPVGLIQAAVGGTPAEAWTPREALVAEPSLRPAIEELERAMRDPALHADLVARLAAWEAKNFHQDRGNRGERLGFARPNGGGGWAKMQVPQPWEGAGLKIDGAVWFRRDVDLPAAWAGRELALSLGAIDDFDVTYWNGDRVGETGAETPEYWAAPRHYRVPGRLVKAGRNLIAVRVFDHFGSGGLVGAPIELTVGPAAAAAAGATVEAPLPLGGTWSYKVERRLTPAIVDFGTRPQVPGLEDSTSPSMLWNGMIAPLAGLPVAGVIWYQGESNAVDAVQYRTLFPVMIRAWRAAWRVPTLPFIFVQLPNYDEPGPARSLGDSNWADLREAQAMALPEPKTAMAVTLDIGESGDIHPRNKQEVGRRLALQALRITYAKDVIASGPKLQAAAPEGHAMRVRFSGVAAGLTTVDGDAPKGFLIAGADRVWHQADARIDRDSVVVSSAAVPSPVAVRYGWANDPRNTLKNQADLPAAPFRTDDWVTARATAAAAPPPSASSD